MKFIKATSNQIFVTNSPEQRFSFFINSAES